MAIQKYKCRKKRVEKDAGSNAKSTFGINITKRPTILKKKLETTKIVSMAPSATGTALPILPSIKDFVVQKKDTLPLPAAARARLEKAGIDLSNGYPERPAAPLYLDDATSIRNVEREHVDAGARADKSKSALFSAAKEVIHLTNHIGTEIVGLQLKDLTDQQRDELALLIAERSVVFFRDQDLTPQEQKKLGEHYGEVEVHVSAREILSVYKRLREY